MVRLSGRHTAEVPVFAVLNTVNNDAIPINDAKRLLRTNSSRLQNLPDELDTAHTGESPSTEGEGPRATSIARRYYQQLFDAGAFSSGGERLPVDGANCGLCLLQR